MMFYKNIKVKICSLDGDTDFFYIAAGDLQGDTLARYLFIIYLDYVLRMSIKIMKDIDFTLRNARSRCYPLQTIMDADYIDVIALLANTPNQTKSLLHNLELAARGISHHVNADKTKYISSLNGGFLKLLCQFYYMDAILNKSCR